MTIILDKTTKYDRHSFHDALSSLELLPARYRLDKNVTEKHELERGRKQIETTYYLGKTNVLAVGLEKLWCWLTRKEFNREAYDISRITTAIIGHFTQNYLWSVEPRIIQNLSNLSKKLAEASESKDEIGREQLIRLSQILGYKIESLKII